VNFYEIPAGSPQERGYTYGHAAHARIRQFLDDGLAQLGGLCGGRVDRARLLALAGDHYTVIARDLPDVAAEIAGLAEGAGIALEEGALLQCRRELTAAGEDCTLLAFRDLELGPVLAQTIDLPGQLDDYVQVVRYCGAAAGGTADILMWSYTGLVGYMGMNGHGLCVGINMVQGGDWAPGVPPYLLVRHLLTHRDITGALAALDGVTLASSRCLTLVDKDGAVTVEMTPQARRLLKRLPLVHTNHFLHADLVPCDRIDSARSSTFTRYHYLQEVLSAMPDLTVKRARALLADHTNAPASICVHSGRFAQGKTVSAVIAMPREGRLEICPGAPCQTPWLTIL